MNASHDSHCHAHDPLPPCCEALEPRTLLSVMPRGPEFLVASDRDLRRPTIASDDVGNFAVAWRNLYVGPYVQLFDPAGRPRTQPILVASTVGTGYDSKVAMDADGDFVVSWEEWGIYSDLDRDRWGIHARLFDAAGTPRGEEFLVVNEWGVNGWELGPVLMDDDGGFTVVEALPYSPPGGGIYAHRFSADGTRIGNRVLLDGVQPGGGGYDVAMDADGDLAVVWHEGPQVGEDLLARRFDGAGAPLGDPIVVDSNPTPRAQAVPRVASDDAGDFVVVWNPLKEADRATTSFFVARYGADGHAQGARLAEPGGLVAYTNVSPTVAMDAVGDFITAWCPQDADAIRARTYSRAGQPGSAFDVSTVYSDREADVAMDADGDFVVSWVRDYVKSVWARTYDYEPPAGVVGRYAFYNDSSFDGNGPFANAADDGAIATDKSALLATSDAAPSFANVTSYSKGINGVMVDISRVPAGQTINADDFDFGGAAQPAIVTLRRGAGAGGSDRVTFVWPDYDPLDLPDSAVANGWLTVTVKANEHTGLEQPDVFSFGNLIGETGDGGGAAGWRVSALDLGVVKKALNSAAGLTSPADVNRDGRVNALDLGAVKRGLNRSLAPPLAAAPGSLQAWPSAPTFAARSPLSMTDEGESIHGRLAADLLA